MNLRFIGPAVLTILVLEFISVYTTSLVSYHIKMNRANNAGRVDMSPLDWFNYVFLVSCPLCFTYPALEIFNDHAWTQQHGFACLCVAVAVGITVALPLGRHWGSQEYAQFCARMEELDRLATESAKTTSKK